MSKPGRYSKVSRRMWGDQKVRRLTQPPPCGFTLFQRFLTGPELTNVPGLFPAWEGGLANAMRWPLEAFREAFREVFREGLAEADWEAGLVWVPNAIQHNEPESPNVVESWGATLSELPDCELKDRAISSLFEWIKARDKASGKPTDKPWEKAWRKGYSPPSRNQEQEQEQDLSKAAASLAKDLKASAQDPEPQSAPRPPQPRPQVAQHSEVRPPIPAPRVAPALPIVAGGEHSEPPAPKPASEGNLARLPTRTERVRTEWSDMPIAEFARRCRENPHDGGVACPQFRPEVVQINEAWCKAVGIAARPIAYLSPRNRPLLAILEALEIHPVEVILKACEQAARDPWCRGEVAGRDGRPGVKRGPECLTPVVLQRLLDAAEQSAPTNVSPAVAAMLAEEKKRMAGAK